MTDPTPETAPRMHAAANESIEAMFKQGCAMEVELAEARKERDEYRNRLQRSAVEHANELLQHAKTKQGRDALLAAGKRLAELAHREHYNCEEDTWYGCPLSRDGCCNDAIDKTKCNCGADEHNAEVEQLLKTFVR